ncbi:hypothetical protein [Amycolatopsis sp.]|uniref:hypothetical protein n=1 Tax=Amycolatopsis sp. TaxID=37632 RepID=UPI00262431B7|nr:hypothetical protein [Amycolatopsis sp.]
MGISATAVVGELKLLRKGRGISAAQLGERVGPALRAVFGISEDEDTAEIRRKTSECLRAFAAPLPEDLRTAVLAAFGLHEDARNPFYQDRVRWVAQTLDRDVRTVRRRIDEGIEQVAELAVAAESEPPARPYPSRSWHTEELRVSLALDQPVPEAFEFRRVVADAEDIAELDLALTLTDSVEDGRSFRDDELDVDVFHGGLLTGRVMESSDRVGLALQLPAPLRLKERHEILLRFRAVLRQPHYVCVPRHPVDLFDLNIRFPRPGPVEIVQLEKVLQNDARDHQSRGVTLTPDDSGEVHVQFRHLAPGFAYGVRWQP